MIVVDTNVIASLFIQRPDSRACRDALAKDRAWVVPPLWRSELLSVLRHETRLAEKPMQLETARSVLHAAETFFGHRERRPSSERVLDLSSKRLRSYDAEFLALAEEVDAPVISNDADFLRVASSRGMTPEAFLAT